MYLATFFFLFYFFRFLYLEGTLYKFATNSQISSYSKSYISDKCITFFFSKESPLMVLITYAQSAPKWPAGYKWTVYVPYTSHDHVRVQRKSTMSWHLHSKL